MTLTIQLTPDAERRLRQNAIASGKTVEQYIEQLLRELPEAPAPSEHETTVALFQQWAEEDARLTPEEAARDDDDWQQIETNILANRLTLPVPKV